MNRISYRKFFGAVITLLVLCETATAQYNTKIDILKGEKWWGVFIGGDQPMPLEEPFPKTDLSVWTKSNAIPFLVSSRGRYIWSKTPFKIEFTGETFLIDSPIEEVEAVTGGKTLREAYLVCYHKNFAPQEGEDRTPASEFFTTPVYDLTSVVSFGISADEIRNYMQEILAAGYPAGTLIIPSGWQSTIGSFSPDLRLYGDFASLVNDIHAQGFKIMLTVTPFVSGDGPIYRAYRNSNAFVKLSDGRTAMAEWAGGYSAFYDITRNDVVSILHKQLTLLRDSLGVDGYLFDCKDALPYARFAYAGAAEFLKKWSELGLDFGLSQYTICRSDGFVPYLHDLQMDRALDWEFLKQAVSSMLTANLLGHPYSTISAESKLSADSLAANPTLLLRYIQLSTALPVTVFSFAPWKINDATIVEQCKKAFAQRQKIGTYYDQLIHESARTGEPILRHMEYEFPRNGFTDCNDQFMIGSKYLVAPLLEESNSRTVRFPRGIWISPQGERIKGPVVKAFTSEQGEILIFESAK